MQTEGRHHATQHLAQFFGWEHLSGPLQPVSKACHDHAAVMIATLPDGPELTTGLRKLLEAKDCFVRGAAAAMLDAKVDLEKTGRRL